SHLQKTGRKVIAKLGGLNEKELVELKMRGLDPVFKINFRQRAAFGRLSLKAANAYDDMPLRKRIRAGEKKPVFSVLSKIEKKPKNVYNFQIGDLIRAAESKDSSLSRGDRANIKKRIIRLFGENRYTEAREQDAIGLFW
ncbi:MAG: hypothetical protein V1911_03190, partial [Candidatus Micrarchaeota archaeon]